MDQHPDAINRNMRCIEISLPFWYRKAMIAINRNMRCIEIIQGL